MLLCIDRIVNAGRTTDQYNLPELCDVNQKLFPQKASDKMILNFQF